MGGCAHFLLKKQRECGQATRPGASLCGAHSPTHSAQCERCGTRLSPHALSAHLRVCPRARADAAVSRAAWYDYNCNRPPVGDVTPASPSLTFDAAVRALEALDERVHPARALSGRETVERAAIARRWADPRTSWARGEMRHIAQAAALCSLLLEDGDVDACAELGAGRAYASLYIAETVAMRGESASFFAVDRGANRHKADGALRAMAERDEGVETFMRGRADIAHVKLAGAGLAEVKRARVVGKHVCGAGTDAALRAVDELCAVWRKGRKEGEMRIVVAGCCRSTCEWDALHGMAEDWAEMGIGRECFDLVANRASWGVNREEIDGEKARIGKICRLGVDAVRVRWLRKRGWIARLVAYVGEDVTTENVCIVATWKIGGEE